jgi:hypothetical protein
MRSTGAKRSSNLTESSSRIKDVLENILRDVQIEAFVREAQMFKIFAANALYDVPGATLG